jgi:hypothetical protein
LSYKVNILVLPSFFALGQGYFGQNQVLPLIWFTPCPPGKAKLLAAIYNAM